MSMTVTTSASVSWTPTAAPTGSGNSAFNFSVSAEASSTGVIDIPSSTAPATDFVVPFGSVNAAQFVVIENKTSQTLELCVNSSSDLISIPALGSFIYSSPTVSATHPIVSLTLTTVETKSTNEYVNFMVFGS